MCSELFRIPYVWGGVPIFGFGVLMALWVVAAAVTLVVLVRHHGWSGETLSSLPVMLLVPAALVLLPKVFPDGLPIRGYGVMLLIGATSGVALAVYRARQVGLDQELILSLAFWMFICGIVGARMFYVIEYWQRRFAAYDMRQRILEILNFPQGGLVIFGALFGAAIAFVFFVRRHKLPLLATADLIAPSLLVGLAFGRIGCLLNGCCYGGECDWPWAVTFPPGSPPYEDQIALGDFYGIHLGSDDQDRPVVSRVYDGSPAKGKVSNDERITAINGQQVTTMEVASKLLRATFASGEPLVVTLSSGKEVGLGVVGPPKSSLRVHPAQVYSAIDAGLLAWLLWAYYPFRRRDGEVLALMLTIHPITRFLLEIIRTDEPAVFGTGMSISQNISLGIFVGAMGLWWYLSHQPWRVTWGAAA